MKHHQFRVKDLGAENFLSIVQAKAKHICSYKLRLTIGCLVVQRVSVNFISSTRILLGKKVSKSHYYIYLLKMYLHI